MHVTGDNMLITQNTLYTGLQMHLFVVGGSHSDLPWLFILNNELDATAEWPILG